MRAQIDGRFLFNIFNYYINLSGDFVYQQVVPLLTQHPYPHPTFHTFHTSLAICNVKDKCDMDLTRVPNSYDTLLDSSLVFIHTEHRCDEINNFLLHFTRPSLCNYFVNDFVDSYLGQVAWERSEAKAHL
jgi:hypothetical protein